MKWLCNVLLNGERVNIGYNRCIEEIVPQVSELPSAQGGFDGDGGLVLPGLHDHHLHFFALAAARASVDCSESTLDQLRERLAHHPQQGWLRLVNWDEAYLPNLDAPMLEGLCPGRPVRAQHRSGKVWVLNNTACEMLNLNQVSLEGVERDAGGKITGRLFRMDRWLAEQLGPATLPVHELSRELHSYGITGFTDTSFTNNQARVDALKRDLV